MKKITVLLIILVAITMILSGCGEITKEDIAGKYYRNDIADDVYYSLSETNIEYNNGEETFKYGEYTFEDSKIKYNNGEKDCCLVYDHSDQVLYTDKPLQGEVPDGDRFNTQCEFTNATDSVGVNVVYKFKDDGTLTAETQTASILGDLGFTKTYYYKRNGNIIELKESKTDDKEYMYVKDGKLYKDVSVKG